jgi:hypothetical protein
LTSTDLQPGLGKAATDAEQSFKSTKQPNISTPQRNRRDEMRSKDPRDQGPVGDMSARLSTGTRTSERVLRCVRATRKSMRCRKDSGTSTAMSPVSCLLCSPHFREQLGTRAQNPTLSQHCGTSYRRRDQFKIFVTRSYARAAKIAALM